MTEKEKHKGAADARPLSYYLPGKIWKGEDMETGKIWKRGRYGNA